MLDILTEASSARQNKKKENGVTLPYPSMTREILNHSTTYPNRKHGQTKKWN